MFVSGLRLRVSGKTFMDVSSQNGTNVKQSNVPITDSGVEAR